jgi:methylase of polypeptide subunit release factors
VFSPVRGEYVDLVATAPLPAECALAFDIGTGSGIIAAVLARRGVQQVIATDQDERALACAFENIENPVDRSNHSLKADLFPEACAARGVQSAVGAGPANVADRIRGL